MYENTEPEVRSSCLVCDCSRTSSIGVVYHPWKKEEMGDQSREIMYTISITNPLAPKTATVTETQVTSRAYSGHKSISLKNSVIYYLNESFLIDLWDNWVFKLWEAGPRRRLDSTRGKDFINSSCVNFEWFCCLKRNCGMSRMFRILIRIVS